MSRITKTIAEDVARQLTAKKSEEVDKLKNDLKLLNTQIYVSKLPSSVMDMFEDYPEYFNKSSSESVTGPGLNKWHRVEFTRSLPRSNNNSINLDAKEAQKIIKLEDKIEDKGKAYKELFEKIEIALINLRTYANVQREFPEAFKLLPASNIGMKLAVNVADIRKQL